MKHQVITKEELERALSLRDLSDPQQGRHAMQEVLDSIHQALSEHYGCPSKIHRASPVVSVEDNYDRLGYPREGVARDARYTRYVSDSLLLRTQTTAMMPGLLRDLAVDLPDDLLLIAPGLVYRRDVVDRLHTGEPHQVDLLRLKRGVLTVDDLKEMVRLVVEAALPGYEYSVTPAVHPYTTNGLEINVLVDGEPVEIGECGIASPAILEQSGLAAGISGLAMGLGLDRILMIRKRIGDIRLLRSSDPRIAGQMLDLKVYVPVSNQPPVRRDLSLAVESDLNDEEIGDRIREALAVRLDQLESIKILSETAYEDLPPAAHQRMGMRSGQKNVLLRLVLRDHSRTLTSAQANLIRDEVYRVLHQGDRLELAA